MNRLAKSLMAGILSVTALSLLAGPSSACTTFRLQSQDGAWIIGRSMELGLQLDSKVMLVPRKYRLATMRPDMSAGDAWLSKFGFLGINTLGMDIATDGMNEAGLSAHALYIPGFFEYQPYPTDGKNALANTDVVNWILSQYESVDEVRAALPKVKVFALDIPKAGVQPLHWAVRDANGGSIVIEYVKGKLTVHDNPLGVLTNAPNFDWHLTNLRAHMNLTNVNVDGLKLGAISVPPLGQGSGLVGLPGDYTPPSRFLRATALTYAAAPVASAKEGANLAFHILNAVDIPIGAVAEKAGPVKDGKQPLAYEQTQWVTVYDLKNKTAYFRTYGNLNIRKVEVGKVQFDGNTIQHIPMSREMLAEDLTPTAKR
jgi:choloylglycine hydrolase